MIKNSVKDMQLVVPSLSRSNKVEQISWSPPVDDILKLNVDATFDKNSNVAGLGVVIRDSNSVIRCSAFTRKLHVQSVMWVEILVVHMGMELVAELNFRNICVEMDCLVCSFHVKRDANKLAHLIASLDYHDGDREFWWQQLPPNVFFITCYQYEILL
ncbi:hypothetical protein REPUB_Repub17cG0037300 [Reevesia pubescens]